MSKQQTPILIIGNKLKTLLQIMWSAFALSSVWAFLNSDSHEIISREGLEYLED